MNTPSSKVLPINQKEGSYVHSLCSGSQWTDPHHGILWAENVCCLCTACTGLFLSSMESIRSMSWWQACKATVLQVILVIYMVIHSQSNQFKLAFW